MPTRNGKIANLPNDIREQLNLRLLEGETGRELAAWLNALPEVQSVLGSQFNGASISEVNLTHWRQGGYLQWLTERECFDSARALDDAECHLAKTGFSAERLLNVLTVRFGQLLMRWDLPPDEGVSDTAAFAIMAKKARILQGISRSVLAIHRIQSRSALAKIETMKSSPNSGAALKSSADGGDAVLAELIRTMTSGASVEPTGKDALRQAQGHEPLGELSALTPSIAPGALSGNRNASSERQAKRVETADGGRGKGQAQSTIAHTPFKADPDPSEMLAAV